MRSKFDQELVMLAASVAAIGCLWVISHFHVYSLSIRIWHLGIDTYLVHGSLWTDINLSMGFEGAGTGSVFASIERDDYWTESTDGSFPGIRQPTIRKTLLGDTVFRMQNSSPDYFVSISVSIWLMLVALGIAVILRYRMMRRS